MMYICPKKQQYMSPLTILSHYYAPDSKAYPILLNHSQKVADKAVMLAERHPELELDIQFIHEASILHDIGIFLTDAPQLGCHGEKPYICHGYLGAELMLKEGYPRHALVCERHTGAGISREMIRQNHLPLPDRDMLPLSLEEQLIAFSDKFFSKSRPDQEKNTEEIRNEIKAFGEKSLKRFDHWCELFL